MRKYGTNGIRFRQTLAGRMNETKGRLGMSASIPSPEDDRQVSETLAAILVPYKAPDWRVRCARISRAFSVII